MERRTPACSATADTEVLDGPTPRSRWHTFWNAGDEPARILEIIAPAGFEQFFAEPIDLGGGQQAGLEALAGLRERYGLDMQPDSVCRA